MVDSEYFYATGIFAGIHAVLWFAFLFQVLIHRRAAAASSQNKSVSRSRSSLRSERLSFHGPDAFQLKPLSLPQLHIQIMQQQQQQQSSPPHSPFTPDGESSVRRGSQSQPHHRGSFSSDFARYASPPGKEEATPTATPMTSAIRSVQRQSSHRKRSSLEDSQNAIGALNISPPSSREDLLADKASPPRIVSEDSGGDSSTPEADSKAGGGVDSSDSRRLPAVNGGAPSSGSGQPTHSHSHVPNNGVDNKPNGTVAAPLPAPSKAPNELHLFPTLSRRRPASTVPDVPLIRIGALQSVVHPGGFLVETLQLALAVDAWAVFDIYTFRGPAILYAVVNIMLVSMGAYTTYDFLRLRYNTIVADVPKWVGRVIVAIVAFYVIEVIALTAVRFVYGYINWMALINYLTIMLVEIILTLTLIASIIHLTILIADLDASFRKDKSSGQSIFSLLCLCCFDCRSTAPATKRTQRATTDRIPEGDEEAESVNEYADKRAQGVSRTQTSLGRAVINMQRLAWGVLICMSICIAVQAYKVHDFAMDLDGTVPRNDSDDARAALFSDTPVMALQALISLMGLVLTYLPFKYLWTDLSRLRS